MWKITVPGNLKIQSSEIDDTKRNLNIFKIFLNFNEIVLGYNNLIFIIYKRRYFNKIVIDRGQDK